MKLTASGKRKRAIAKAIISEGSGKVTVNKINHKVLHFLDRLKIEEPLRIFENVVGKPNFDVQVTVMGGGRNGQIEAARLALARAISDFSKSKELTAAFLAYDRQLLVADVRRKEMNKPGDSKARSKRQKSFR